VAFGGSGDGSDRIRVTLQNSSKMEAHVSCVVYIEKRINGSHHKEEDKRASSAKKKRPHFSPKEFFAK